MANLTLSELRAEVLRGLRKMPQNIKNDYPADKVLLAVRQYVSDEALADLREANAIKQASLEVAISNEQAAHYRAVMSAGRKRR